MDQLPSSSSVRYRACDHIKKKKPDIFVDSDEKLRSFAPESEVLPLFEKKTFDYTRMKHYSLQTNESLRCCWQEFLRQLEGWQRTPFQFPNANDFHFYKYHTRYEPSQSIANRAQLKILTFGQCGEIRGYAPVPNEMHTRKTSANVRKPRAPARAPARKFRRRLLKY